MGTSVSSCQQKAESGMSSHQNGNKISLLATMNCFSAAPSRVAKVVATAPSESDDVLLWALENAVILELASALKLTRLLEACVETEVEDGKAVKRTTQIYLEDLNRSVANRSRAAGELLCDCAMNVDAGGEPAEP